MTVHRTAASASGDTAALHAPGLRRLTSHWPAALGLALTAVLLATGVADTVTVALTGPAAAMCYFAAAALGRPWVAWLSIPGVMVLIVLGEVVGLPWWAVLALAGLLLALLGRALGTAGFSLNAQAGALVAFTAAGAIALAIEPRAAVLVAGLALSAHSIWDLVHYRRGDVVPRSLAETCMWLDAPLGIGLIIVSFTV